MTLPVACGGGPPSGLHGGGVGDGMCACVQCVLLHLSPEGTGVGPSPLLSARRHRGLARVTAASAEGDMKELLALFPAREEREARRVLGAPQRREAGRQRGSPLVCLVKNQTQRERMPTQGHTASNRRRAWAFRLPVSSGVSTGLQARGRPLRGQHPSPPRFHL